jgi:carboxypeptidase C (cathepsin A)
MDHLELSPTYRANISYATYNAGHMVYVDTDSLAKFKRDLASFVDKTVPRNQQ